MAVVHRSYTPNPTTTTRLRTAHDTFTMTSESIKIKSLNGESNYATWLMDVKALLRRHKIWDITQEAAPVPTADDQRTTAIKNYNNKDIEAADLLTPTLSDGVKLELSPNHFDSGYLMLKRLDERYAPKNNTTFFTLHRDLFTCYYDLKDTDALITKIRTLNEQIEACKVEMTADKRALLVLSMAMAACEPSLAQLWSVTEDMTFDRAATMLRDRTRVAHLEADHQLDYKKGLLTLGHRQNDYDKKTRCTHCGKTHGPVCFRKNPELAPDWYREMNKNSRPNTTSTQALTL